MTGLTAGPPVRGSALVPSDVQRAAIEAPLGPVLVVAGPGAGKTYCLIERVRHLVTRLGFAPRRLCAVTFTNRAAEEIADRLGDALGPAAELVTRGTLHALCAEVLRTHGAPVGVPRGFGIADDPYQRLLLRRLGVRRQRWGQLLTLFSRRRLQGHPLSVSDENLFRRYVHELRRRELLDFDDLIVQTVRLFRRHPAIEAEVAGRWDYLLVDEFQDLDPAQYALIRALALPHRNVFAVGDDEQSIFSWRGADPKGLRRFADDFGITSPIVLDKNRRCSRQIFARARALMQVERGLFEKRLEAERESPHEVAAYRFPDDEVETGWLLADLEADRRDAGLAWGDYAVLYRRHEVGNRLESALLRAGIPCRLARGRALQDDPVVGYVVAALRLMRHPEDPVLVERFAEVVLPPDLVEQVRLAMGDAAGDFLEGARRYARARPKGAPDARKAWRFLYHVENLAAQYRMHESVPALVEDLLGQRVGPYTNALEERYDDLTDPTDDPAAVALADRLTAILHARGRAIVTAPGPVRVALRGLLLAGSVTLAAYAEPGDEPRPGDVPVDANPLLLFKALQLVHSRELEHEFSDYVAFDLETTDNDVEACEIVEIGAARVRGGQVVDRFHTLVRPRVPVSAKAREVHGYGDADLARAPGFEEVWPRLRDFIGADLLVAHNALDFDVPVLRRMAGPLGGATELTVYDSLLLARSLFRSGARLQTLAERFGIGAGRAHHALDDAETLVGVFRELSRLQLARARKAALVNLLDYVGLGLALTDGPATDEAEVFREISRPFALGRYGESLEFYAAEWRRLADPALPAPEVVIERLGGAALMARLRADRSAEERYPEAYARIRRLLDANPAPTLAEGVDRLLDQVALSSSDGVEVDRQRVNLLTLHSTKGLEFSRVYLIGAEDHELPGYYQTTENRTDEIEEARRLLYVGMTRAKDRLVLTRVERRNGREAGGNRFLDEMGLAAIPP